MTTPPKAPSVYLGDPPGRVVLLLASSGSAASSIDDDGIGHWGSARRGWGVLTLDIVSNTGFLLGSGGDFPAGSSRLIAPRRR